MPIEVDVSQESSHEEEEQQQQAICLYEHGSQLRFKKRTHRSNNYFVISSTKTQVLRIQFMTIMLSHALSETDLSFLSFFLYFLFSFSISPKNLETTSHKNKYLTGISCHDYYCTRVFNISSI